MGWKELMREAKGYRNSLKHGKKGKGRRFLHSNDKA